MRMKITEDQINDFLIYMEKNHKGNNPIPRILMSEDEIKCAEKLVKRGLLIKGTIEGSRLKNYYLENKI